MLAPNELTPAQMRVLNASGQLFANFCLAQARDQASYNWEDPCTGQPIAHIRYRVGDWICTCTWEGNELTEWGYSHITADN